jgi:Na+-transporting NADH:ubiquinone oxidoreductase subunit F
MAVALRKIEKQFPNFKFYIALSEPLPDDHWKVNKSLDDTEGDGYIGFIHKSLFDNYLANHPSPEDVEYYLCGPPLMNAAVLKMLDDMGIPKENIRFDDFGG